MKKNLIILLLSLFFALKIDAQCDGVPYFNYWNTTNNMSFYPHVTEPYYLVETNWAFSDGQNMNQTSSYHVITSFSETGTHEVCVTYTIASSVDENYFCVTTICESFEVNCISLDVDLTSTIDPVDGTFEVTANVMNGVAPYSFQWWVWPGTILTTNDNTIFCDFEDHSYAQVNCSVIEQNGSLGCGSQYATITALNPQVDCEISLTATVMENVVSVEATMMDGEYSPTYPYIYFDFGDGSVPVAAEVGWTSPDVTHAPDVERVARPRRRIAQRLGQVLADGRSSRACGLFVVPPFRRYGQLIATGRAIARALSVGASATWASDLVHVNPFCSKRAVDLTENGKGCPLPGLEC